MGRSDDERIPIESEDTDDTTPADPPGAAISRFAEHQYDLCAALHNVGPRLDDAPRDVRIFILDNLIAIVGDVVDGFTDSLRQLKEQREMEMIFRRRDK